MWTVAASLATTISWSNKSTNSKIQKIFIDDTYDNQDGQIEMWQMKIFAWVAYTVFSKLTFTVVNLKVYLK